MSPTIRPTDVSAPFWDGVRQKRFLLQFDLSNGRAQFYPRPQSLYSAAGTEWREAKGQGTLLAVTINRVASPGFEDQVPFAIGLVQLVEGPRVLARLEGKASMFRVGEAMQLVWAEGNRDEATYRFAPERLG